MTEPFTHPFLTDQQHESLKKAVEIFKKEGKLSPIEDDGHITLILTMNGVTVPPVQAGDNHQVVLFSDAEWSYIVVRYSGFSDKDQNGMGALRVKRDYITNEFKRGGDFNPVWARKIVDCLLCILQVDPAKVDFDFGSIQGVGR